MKSMFLHCMAVLLMLSTVFSEAHGQWVQGNGIYGGTVTALASSGNTVFAGTPENGIYSSINNGGTWIQTGLNNLDVQPSPFQEITFMPEFTMTERAH